METTPLLAGVKLNHTPPAKLLLVWQVGAKSPVSVALVVLMVNGASGYWISGGVHEIIYLDPNGVPISNTLRLAGNVLLWQRGDVTLRIESSLSLEQALAVARTVR